MSQQLWEACESGNVNLAKTSMKIGVPDSNYANPAHLHYTPLHVASENGHCVIIEFLLRETSANIMGRTDHGYTPLHLAARHGGIRPVAMLLMAGGQVCLEQRNRWGETPLHTACKSHCNTDVVKYLLANHAEIDAQDREGCTPLMYACQEGVLSTVKALLEAGANPLLRDHDDCSVSEKCSIGEKSYIDRWNGHLDGTYKVVNVLLQHYTSNVWAAGVGNPMAAHTSATATAATTTADYSMPVGFPGTVQSFSQVQAFGMVQQQQPQSGFWGGQGQSESRGEKRGYSACEQDDGSASGVGVAVDLSGGGGGGSAQGEHVNEYKIQRFL